MIRWFKQWWCPHLGKTNTVPICGRWPHSPDIETTYCCDCGKVLAEER